MYCTNCGNEIPDNSKFCKKCGARITEDGKNINAPQMPQVNQPPSASQPQNYQVPPQVRQQQNYQPTNQNNNKKPKKVWLIVLISVFGALGLLILLLVAIALIAPDEPDRTTEAVVESTQEIIDIQLEEEPQLVDELNNIKTDLVLMEEFIDFYDNNDSDIDEGVRKMVEYKTKFENKIDEVKKRDTQNPDLVKIQEAEIELFETSVIMIDEVEQIVNYLFTILEVYENMDATINSADENDINSVYTALGNAFDTALEELNNTVPPTFMEYNHSRMYESMDMLSRVSYLMVYYSEKYDLLNMSNYEYFIDYYGDVLAEYMTLLENDTDSRLGRFDSDMLYMKEWTEEIDKFLDTSIIDSKVNINLLDEKYLAKGDMVNVSYTVEYITEIIPANYRSLDYLAFIEIMTDKSDTDVMITVEIPEFTQKYQQKVTIGRAETEIAIRPPLLSDFADKLNSSKEAMLNIRIEDMSTGEIITQESMPVTLYSIYDMKWYTNGEPNYENILSWVTPENDEVLSLLRESADVCYELSDGWLNSIQGYQGGNGNYEEQKYITFLQVAAIMNAMADAYDVKYIMASFSTTDSGLQRIATPERVLENASGLCIETAVTLASALTAADMHALIVLTPGHAQVAVETWQGSGEYFLVETTALDAARGWYFNDVIYDFTKEDWNIYISEKDATAISCYMINQLDIHPID